MRNCFVPQCDAFCKKNGILKRMMFLAPKDNFENWKDKLFNKREFRETDRVCERHFDKNQILTHWDHIIDGKLCQLEREKPKIKSDAVPYLNLPETENVTATTNKKRGSKHKPEQKKRKQNLIFDRSEKVFKKEIKLEDDHTIPTFDVENDENQIEQTTAEFPISKTNGRVKTRAQNRLSDEEKRQIFDAVYDDIYEVVLPNTLWGNHRDPEDRQYIAFTLFDANKMNCSIAVKITDNFNLKVYKNGIQTTCETLSELNVDVLTKLVNELNNSAEQETKKCLE